MKGQFVSFCIKILRAVKWHKFVCDLYKFVQFLYKVIFSYVVCQISACLHFVCNNDVSAAMFHFNMYLCGCSILQYTVKYRFLCF
jgi:hypothetical protein